MRDETLRYLCLVSDLGRTVHRSIRRCPIMEHDAFIRLSVLVSVAYVGLPVSFVIYAGQLYRQVLLRAHMH